MVFSQILVFNGQSINTLFGLIAIAVSQGAPSTVNIMLRAPSIHPLDDMSVVSFVMPIIPN